MFRSKYEKIVLHIAGCLVFLCIPIVFAPQEVDFSDLLNDHFTRREFSRHILLLLFFYLSYDVIVPKIYFRQKYLLFSLIMAGCLLLIAYIPGILLPPPGPPFPHKPPPGFQGHFPFLFPLEHSFLKFTAVFGVAFLFRMNGRLKRAEQEKLQAELSFLKAQMNPHFLFNTLNGIYAQALQKSDDTATSIVKLSGMMRYILGEAHHDFVSLEKEIVYLTDYIALQKIRLGDTVTVSFRVEGETGETQIAPLILIPFIENAFKYGINPEKKSAILVDIQVSPQQLTLTVENTKVVAPHTHKGLGISNTRERLRFLYPGKHQLEIREDVSLFTVILTIDLK